jgi:hypothetical protein
VPLTTQDRLEIMELAARYAYTIDRRMGEEWADCFTEDGEMISGNGNRVAGRAAFIEHMRKARESGKQVRHWGCNHIIEGDGQTARLRMYLMAVDIGNGIAPYVMGNYDDVLIKINGKWKFRTRRIHFAAGGI